MATLVAFLIPVVVMVSGAQTFTAGPVEFTAVFILLSVSASGEQSA